MCERMSSKLFS
jgi:beta-glucosidase/6-phospho-beta-glucosidase/beta-galactosidase